MHKYKQTPEQEGQTLQQADLRNSGFEQTLSADAKGVTDTAGAPSGYPH